MTVSSLVLRAARSCEILIAESTETVERLVGFLLPGAGPNPEHDEPWWATPEGDDRFVDLSGWDPVPAGPWAAC